MPFDTRRLEVTGLPARVIDNLLPSNWLPHYTFSSDGTLVYVPSEGRKLGRELVWLDRDGRVEALPLPERVFRMPRLSPDGSRIAVQVEGANEQIWIHDLARGVLPSSRRYGTTKGRCGRQTVATWRFRHHGMASRTSIECRRMAAQASSD